jgi:predicted outer membrane repeat protein
VKKHFTFRQLITFCFTIFSTSVYSEIIYVNTGAAGANNGTSWTNAFNKLSDALIAASPGDEIWVTQGVYKPELILDLNLNGGTDPREAVFIIPDGVALYSGFTGTEINREDRNWITNLTILSGDIDNNDINVDDNNIAENSEDVIGNNAYHIIFTENVSPSTLLNGFIVTAGKADILSPVNAFDPNLDGGGWYNKISSPVNSSSPTITNCSFLGNYAASEGGAIFNSPGAVSAENLMHIENSLFSKNKSNNTAGALYLGSFTLGNYQPVIINCRFIDNEAFRRGGAIYMVGDNSHITSSLFDNNRVTAISEDASTLPGSGGAINLVASNAVFISCQFISNSSTGNPTGAFEGGGGGALHISANEPQTNSLGASEPEFIGCGFFQNLSSGNTAAWGGAITHLCDGGILRPKYVNCVFSENHAQNHGGAIANFVRTFFQPSGFDVTLNPLITNCTFFNNSANQLGGGLYLQGFNFEGTQLLETSVENSILWGNQAGSSGDQIYNSGVNLVSYSLIEGSGGSGGSWNISLGTDEGNNMDDNPDFVNSALPFGADNIPATDDDGLRLLMTSNALNSGNNSATGLEDISTDFAGESRILSGTIDIGAYERSGIILPDLDIYWLVDWPDINPPCLNCPLPWSFLLFTNFGIKPQFIWKGPAQLILKDDLATITGEIVNYSSPEISFKVHLELTKPLNWYSWKKIGGTYFSETKESRIIAIKEHVNWKYWTLSKDSHIEGTGELQGKLSLKQMDFPFKTAFQMGLGANARDDDFGVAGKFIMYGKLKYKKKNLIVTGQGNMNVDAIECIKDCDPILPNLFTFNENELKNATITNATQEFSLNVYPNPAKEFLFVELNAIENKSAVVIISDVMGREIYRRNLTVYDSKIVIPLNGLNTGIYILKVDLNNSETISKKFIKN